MTLLKANDFARDWYGYATNQAGHAAIIGGGLALLALTVLPALWVPPLVALAYGVIWEWAIQRGRMWWDSLEDTAHVMAGAAPPAAAVYGAADFWFMWATLAACYGAWVAVLSVGVIRRKIKDWRGWTL